MRRSRKIAAILASMGLGVGLLGYGVNASFTSSASATDNIAVGSFGIDVTSTAAGAVFAPAGCLHTYASPCTSVTLTAATLQSSAAGTAPLPFTINNVGSIPAVVTVTTATSPATLPSPFSDSMTNPGPQTIAAGGNFAYSGGLAWGALSNSNLGQNVSITYTASATG